MTTPRMIKDKDVEALSEMLHKHPELIQKVRDVAFTKDMIGSVQTLLIAGINKTIHEGGWEQLIAGSETNEQLVALITNPSIILYSQLLMVLVLAVAEIDPDLALPSKQSD